MKIPYCVSILPVLALQGRRPVPLPSPTENACFGQVVLDGGGDRWDYPLTLNNATGIQSHQRICTPPPKSLLVKNNCFLVLSVKTQSSAYTRKNILTWPF